MKPPKDLNKISISDESSKCGLELVCPAIMMKVVMVKMAKCVCVRVCVCACVYD